MNARAEQPNSALKTIALDYWYGLKGLFGCPREIWIAFLVKILESLCYFSSVLMLMIFLTQDMGLSDTVSGTIFGIFSASMSFFMLFVGFIADSLGIKRALIVGLLLALVGRIAITFTTSAWVVFPGLFFLSVGFAYMIPLLAAAVKLFSNREAQKYAFSWYYVVMNVGSLAAGITLDPIRTHFTEVMTFRALGAEFLVRPSQVVFLVGVLATLVSLVLVVFLIRSRIPSRDEEGARGASSPAKTAARPAPEPKPRESAWAIMKDVTKEKRFWIFIVFIFLLVLVKMIFQYNHSLYPLYMERIGLKEWTGKLYSINPFIIIFLVPVMTALTGRYRAYTVILIGSFVSALSVFFMGLGESIGLIVLFQVVLSLGEAVYSPRLYDYTATIAPKGREASYMAYSKAPMFFAKVAAGPITGILLARLCPAEGPRNTELMWILVGASTMVSPIALLLGWKWLDVERRKERDEAAAAAAGGPEPAAAPARGGPSG
ncbi:MAG: MFS transporter [Candidatus Eisenbacteria bacterium]|nr:MFS transporter [Candidatus Eisenbacteria bacterium]